MCLGILCSGVCRSSQSSLPAFSEICLKSVSSLEANQNPWPVGPGSQLSLLGGPLWSPPTTPHLPPYSCSQPSITDSNSTPRFSLLSILLLPAPAATGIYSWPALSFFSQSLIRWSPCLKNKQTTTAKIQYAQMQSSQTTGLEFKGPER